MTRFNSDVLNALEKLQKGNERYSQGLISVHSMVTPAKLREFAERGQSPFAVILTCSDSRVPAETVFDCGLGELFVIRVAGNIVVPTTMATVEFAVASFGTPLCVVMGHTGCGAVSAAVDAECDGARAPTAAIQDLVNQVRPAVKECEPNAQTPRKDLITQATVVNVRRNRALIAQESQLLREKARAGEFLVVGAVYDLATGCVTFLEESEPA